MDGLNKSRCSSRIKVVHSNGNSERISFDKILYRVEDVCEKLGLDRIDPFHIVKETINGVHDNITTEEIDMFAATKCAERIQDDPQYDKLATGLFISRLHRKTLDDFLKVSEMLYSNVDEHGNVNSLINPKYFDIVRKNKDVINSSLNYERDYLFDFFGIKTMEKAYLLKVLVGGKKVTVERPQHLFMRVALGIHGDDMNLVMETYNWMSLKYFTHASPTLYNCGSNREQLASCFLLKMDDNLPHIFKTISDSAMISKCSGGIGMSIGDIRVKGSHIKGTNGNSNGIVPLCRLIECALNYADQGGGRRKGAGAVYIEPWHADIYDFCDLRKNTGADTLRARDLFLALWVNDIFIKRVLDNQMWSLMCPNECKGLTDIYGDEFEKLYLEYESKNKFVRQVRAVDLWYHILSSQIETGMPYMLYKDHINRQSNQKNIGVIKSSNLCVSGDTYILTDSGQHLIEDLVNKKVNVWNGFEFSETTILQTGKNKELLEVEFSNGVTLKCTPEHKFHIVDPNGNVKIISTKELQLDDKLINFNLPLCPNLSNTESTNPINTNANLVIKWFTDYCNTHQITATKESLLVHGLKHKLFKIKLMLQTFGIDTDIITSEYEDISYDNKLVITLHELHKLSTLGFTLKRITLPTTDYPPQPKTTTITGIKKLKTKYDTFCFNEPKRHTGIFNGIITGQCSEIVQFTSTNETSVCNLASICLPQFIETDKSGNKIFNYTKLIEVSRVVTRNLNKIIDINFYPIDEAKNSNLKHRPIGVGIQGLADVYYIFEYSFESEEAKELNKRIFETIYYGCLLESVDLSKKHGPYESFKGSPFSKGLLQYHLWGLTEENLLMKFNWKDLIKDIKKHGTRNSLLTALMPTATTSQFMGNSESFEPRVSNIYTRSTLTGEFIVINKYLIETLIKLGVWNENIKNELIYDKGSIQLIEGIPENIKQVFRTAFEIKQKSIVQQSVERGPFIDQSQSMNIFCKEPNFDLLTSSHIYGWKNKIKTGMYYLRTQPVVDPIKFGIDAAFIKKIKNRRMRKNKKTPKHEDNESENEEEPSTNRHDINIVECENCSA